MTEKQTQWKNLGTLTTEVNGVLTPTGVTAQQTYVVVGFGVNYPDAYRDGVSYLTTDPGHAFMYTVKSNKVTRLFSFGPRVHGEFLNTLGTPDYGMDYPTRLFKVPVSAQQMSNVEAAVDVYRRQVIDGTMPYRGITNDTCAETVRQILSESGVDTPEGIGPVTATKQLPLRPRVSGGQWPQVKSNPATLNIPAVNIGRLNTPAQKVDYNYPTLEGGRRPDVSVDDVTLRAPRVNAVNPYKWYDEFRRSGKYTEAVIGARGDKWLGVFQNADPAASQW